MSLNILHLSDLHLTAQTDVEALIARVDNAKSSVEHDIKLEPKVIVFTGDIFASDAVKAANVAHTYPSLEQKGVSFFTQLMELFSIDNASEQMFFVPGNHDCDRTELETGSSRPGFQRYSEFLAKIYGDSWTSLMQSVYEPTNFSFVKCFEQEKIILLGLTSPCNERLQTAEGCDAETPQPVESLPGAISTSQPKENHKSVSTARIGDNQIRMIHRRIRAITEWEKYTVIACLHNHIFNTVEEKDGELFDKACVQDNELLLFTLNQYNCSFILHGHKHRHDSRRIIISHDVKQSDKICTVVCAGTLQNDDKQKLVLNSFNYLNVGSGAKDRVFVFCDDGRKGISHSEAFSFWTCRDDNFWKVASLKHRIDTQAHLVRRWHEAQRGDEIWVQGVGYTLFKDRSDVLELLEKKVLQGVDVKVIIHAGRDVAWFLKQLATHAPSVTRCVFRDNARVPEPRIRVYGFSHTGGENRGHREVILATAPGDGYEACVIRDPDHIRVIKTWFDTKFNSAEQS